MSRRRISGWATAVSGLLWAGLATFLLTGVSWVGEVPEVATKNETKDRLPPERMQSLAGAQVALAETGNLSAADAALSRSLQEIRAEQGENSLHEGDMLMAFAVLLFMKGRELEDKELQRAALPYLSRSVAVYRIALGTADPFLAVALTSRADVLLLLNNDVPVPEAEADLEESLRIRNAALGLHNVETIANRRQLAQLMGHPSRVAADHSRLQAAEADFAAMIRDARDDAADGYESKPMLRMALARLLAQNRQGARAIAEANAALDMMRGWPRREACYGTVSVVLLASELEEAGLSAAGLNVPADRADALIGCSGI